jgi:radical SAM superfamily enzyme YgiQ (UPF0313 family)
MELPRRDNGDELLRPGELTSLIAAVRKLSAGEDISTVIACTFDYRTRVLPFIFADIRLIPAGPRAIGSAMLAAGLTKTRIVLQHWNKNFQPSQMKLDGLVPDIFMISSMGMHIDQARQLLRDVAKIPADKRPLVIAGGSLCIYEPWELFSTDPADPFGPDVVVTGEEFVLLSLLERLLANRGKSEPLAQTFRRIQAEGLLGDIAGLVYPTGPGRGLVEGLVDTGIQRLLGDLDEKPSPVGGYSIVEPPSRKATLSSRPIPADKIHKLSPLSTIVLTQGCKFGCQYCPIPAYNQRQYRTKTGPRIAEDIRQLNLEYGLRIFFGADDNFFNKPERTLEIAQTLARAEIAGKPLRRRARIATEVTVHDTIKMAEHLPLIRKGGFRAFWLGVEDMTGSLVSKGQTVDSTTRAFHLLRKNGIVPNPMMMHHDDQKLLTPGRADGLLNQVNILQKAGAGSLQVLMIVPSPGSKLYRQTYQSGMVYGKVAGRKVLPYMMDGTYVIASNSPQPWKKQLNMLLAYLFFYNPIRILALLARPGNNQLLFDVGFQLAGMAGLACTFRRTIGWAFRLMTGQISRRTSPPVSRIPMRSPTGGRAQHDISDPD